MNEFGTVNASRTVTVHGIFNIIAKIDSENLNVYYELGYAMGLHKDTLLISENNFIEKLPSDLKNWECLTYNEGDYEELKNKIVKYYKDN